MTVFALFHCAPTTFDSKLAMGPYLWFQSTTLESQFFKLTYATPKHHNKHSTKKKETP